MKRIAMPKLTKLSLLTIFCGCLLTFGLKAQTKKSVHSPNRNTVFELSNEQGELKYRVTYNNKEEVSWSALGLSLSNGTILGNANTILSSSTRSVNENIPWRLGENDVIQNHYNELTLDCKSANTSSFTFIVRVFNGSVAFSYRLNKLPASVYIRKENTAFNFTKVYTIYSYNEESVFTPLSIDSLSGSSDFPSTLISPHLYTSIGEADNDNYTKPVLIKGKQSNSLAVGFVNDSVRVTGPNFNTPWRTISFSETLLGLHKFSDLNYRLAKAPENGIPSWIKPGKLIRAQLTTASGLQCIDFAVKNNYQYILFDAGWYGKEFNTTSDPTRVIKEIDLPTVIDYGRRNKIGIILYVNYVGLKNNIDSLLPLFKKWGVAGIKFGFVNGIKQQGITWLAGAIKKTTNYGFVINIHDNYKPTGLSRTYPALLTQEGIRGDEHQADAWHHTLLPFTRFLAGAGDNTFCFPPPTSADEVRNKTLLTSKGQQLALPVIYFSPLQAMLWYGEPQHYNNDTEIEFYKLVPTVWNESKYLKGEIGKYVSVARRSGDCWFVGNIAGAELWKDTLSLSFLKKGTTYRVTIYEDDLQGSISKKTILVKRDDSLPLNIQPAQGSAMYFLPVKGVK